MRFLYDPLSMSLRDGVDEYRLSVVLKKLPDPSISYLCGLLDASTYRVGDIAIDKNY